MTARTTLPVPLLGAMLGCLLGVVWQEHSCIQSMTALIALLLASLPLAFHAYIVGTKNHLTLTTILVCMMGSACMYQLPQAILRQLVETYGNHPVTLSGRIHEIRDDKHSKALVLEEIELETSGERCKPTWFTHAIVHVPPSVAAPLNGILHASHIFIKHPPENLKLFHLKQHLLGFFFAKKECITVTPPAEKSSSWLEKQKERLNRSINDVFSPPTRDMVKSVFMGDSQALTNEIRVLFEQWGISHFLARSGLHLVLLATLIMVLLQICGLPILVTRGATLGFSIVYHMLTAPSTSFLRAFMMNSMIGAAVFLGTTPTILHLFSIVTIITILSNPFTPLNLDFQLSFGISGALIFMFTLVQKIDSKNH